MLLLLQLFSLFLLVGLGFYVFVTDPRRRANQTFAAFIAFLAVWTTKDLIFWNFYPRDTTAGWWASVSFVTALLMQYATVVFAWVFPENGRTPRRQASILFAPGLVLIPAAAAGMLWHTVGFENGNFVVDLTPLAYAFVAYVYFLFFFGASILFRKYLKLRGQQQGQQVGAILWGLAITGVLITAANIVLPFFASYALLPFSGTLVLPGVLIYAYAILNFRLFSLQTALDQFRLFPITYKVAVSIASIAVVSFAIFQIPVTWWAFRGGMDAEAWRRYLVFSTITALVPNLLLLLLVLRTISRPLQKLTVAAIDVSKGAYGTEVDLSKSNDEIGVLADSFNAMSRKMSDDIDQLKVLNEQLMRAEKLAAMGTLAAGVAHEVNNPLASISSLVQMMRTQEGHSDETRERLKMISEQIDRIKQVTADMTNFSRPGTDVRRPADVNEIVETALRLASFDRRFGELDVERMFDPELPSVLADRDQLQQVFLNLFLNARDAMDAGGSLAVRTFARDGEVMIEVSDSGPGVSEKDLQYIFDPFFTTKSPGSGTGLGLAVCYGIITRHGGRIEAASRRGEGATFTVRLPAVGSSSNSPQRLT